MNNCIKKLVDKGEGTHEQTNQYRKKNWTNELSNKDTIKEMTKSNKKLTNETINKQK